MLDVLISSMSAKVPNTLALARPLANGGLGETSSGAMSHHNHCKLPEERCGCWQVEKEDTPAERAFEASLTGLVGTYQVPLQTPVINCA